MDPKPSALPGTRPSPRVQRILKVLKLRKAGVGVAEIPWQAFQMRNSEFDELQRWLKKDESLWGFVERKVRYDYDSRKGRLVSRRPTPLHSVFMTRVTTEILRRLREIELNGDAQSRAFASKIRCMDSARIDLLGTEVQAGKPKLRRNPDCSFKHSEAHWAGVVLELSYPSKRKALPHLADDYILETDGNIRVLVGLDLDTVTKKGSISTWRPLFKKDENGVIVELEAALVIDGHVFRDQFGNKNPDPESGLRLALEDFGSTNLTSALKAEDSIFIDSATLCRCLADAKEQVEMQETAIRAPHKRGRLRIKKRRREGVDSNCESTVDEASKGDNTLPQDANKEGESIISANTTTENSNVTSEHEETYSSTSPSEKESKVSANTATENSNVTSEHEEETSSTISVPERKEEQ